VFHACGEDFLVGAGISMMERIGEDGIIGTFCSFIHIYDNSRDPGQATEAI